MLISLRICITYEHAAILMHELRSRIYAYLDA